MNPPDEPRPLRLTPAPPASGERTAAWFLSGGEPSAWLSEICERTPGNAQAELKLYVVPRSGADRRPAGALVVWPGEEPTPASARSQPYRVLIGRFYLPADARLEPPVGDDELTRLCPPGGLFVFHPGAGLCAFRADDALSLSDLLSAPAVSMENWTGAHPGLTPNTRLRSVRLEMPADLGSLFSEAAREIGVDPPNTGEMPPAPGEAATGPAASLGRKWQEWLASLTLGFTGMLPRTASARTWVNDLEDWAKNARGRVSRDLGEIRHRELHRLLHLLENNPAEGLRRALPLAGLFRRRGVAPPGGQLVRRDPNFRLGALAGGGAADAWDVPPDLQARLRERYRQLANEETRLGRYRRAAYIHAELLGDLSSAAGCLKQGEHYHEAAVLYRDHLARPLEAADCLAAGGEYAEAAKLYEKEKCFLQVAAMHHAMGDEGAAAGAYRREVNRLVAADDRIGAAELLETRLGVPDEALGLLWGGWTGGSPQASRCLEKLFERFGARGMHTRAAGLIVDLSAENLAPARAVLLARQLATAQESYPDETVRHAARDLARVTVAGGLPAAEPTEVRGLVELLGRLAPQDRLLVRDGQRYLADRLEQEKRRPAPGPITARTTPPALASRRTVRRAGSFQMPPGARWQQFRSMGNYFLAAGHVPDKRQVKLARVAWDGFSQSVVWPDIGPWKVGEEHNPLLLEAAGQAGGFVVCAPVFGVGPMLGPRRFAVADRSGWQSMECGQPTWWPGMVLAVSWAADGNLWLLRVQDDGDDPILVCHAPHGGIVSQMTFPLSAAQMAAGQKPSGFHIIHSRDCLLIAFADRLLMRQGASTWKELAFDAPITGLVPTPALARAGCAVQLENGVALLWLDQPSEAQTVVTGLARPLAAFTRLGTLAVVSREDRAGRLFEIVVGEAREAAAFSGVGEKPVVLLGTADREAFAIVDEAGPVHLYTG